MWQSDRHSFRQTCGHILARSIKVSGCKQEKLILVNLQFYWILQFIVFYKKKIQFIEKILGRPQSLQEGRIGLENKNQSQAAEKEPTHS